MKKSVLVVLGFLLIGIQACKQETGVVSEKVKDGVFVHISHGTDDVHRALMGLQMAVKMSEDKDVLVYFDITGISFVLKDSEEFTFDGFPGSKTQINKLLSSGVTIMACPGCLKAAGKTESDLMDGIKIADKENFFSFTNGRILTIDY
ncbi:MAG: DsrE family protein [Ignavibacteriales bacterium]|nr:DsrE family protein [Ignavibacteriales bacterium]MCF8317019.1 DsrE family protein [Ignavibacteriales bacterium]MCF8438617.1 DsrE family protein [Ignavibacteriales bacterium]